MDFITKLMDSFFGGFMENGAKKAVEWYESGFITWVGENFLRIVIWLVAIGVVVDVLVHINWRRVYAWFKKRTGRKAEAIPVQAKRTMNE